MANHTAFCEGTARMMTEEASLQMAMLHGRLLDTLAELLREAGRLSEVELMLSDFGTHVIAMARAYRKDYEEGILVETMPKRHDQQEEWAINILQQIIDLDRQNSDALPGSAVRHVKQAITIMKKRRK